MYPGGWYLYGILAMPIRPNHRVGVFQARGVWKEEPNPLVITYSAALLARWLRDHPDWEVHMASPVEQGDPQEAEVLRILKEMLEVLLGPLYQSRTVYMYYEP
jgi:hypothetical protein